VRLALKLGACFGALLALLLCAALWASFESGAGAQRADLDRRLVRATETLARCVDTPASDLERSCLQALPFFVAASHSEALARAVLVDADLRVLVHSDFLNGDRAAKGVSDTEPFVATVANRTEPFVLRTLSAAQRPVALYVAPARSREGRVGTWIAVFHDALLEQAARAAQAELRWRLVQMALLGGGAGLLFSIGLAVYLARPLERLMEASRRVASGDFAGRVPEDRGDELGRLAVEFNAMAARLSELDEMKESFMAQITHDLRAPLSSVVGYADLLLKGYNGPMSDAQTKSVETIIRCGRSLADLVDNILDVTKLEAKRMTVQQETVELPAAVEAVLNLLQVRAQEYGINLDTYLLPELTSVYADPQALSRVLTNLVSNALKFTPASGHVTVKARRGAPNEVIVSVTDTGVGIPKERLGSIFAKFSQVPETKNKVRPVHGTGLGLLISKQLVEAMGGRIWVDSDYGKGTTFSFTLREKGVSEEKAAPVTP